MSIKYVWDTFCTGTNRSFNSCNCPLFLCVVYGLCPRRLLDLAMLADFDKLLANVSTVDITDAFVYRGCLNGGAGGMVPLFGCSSSGAVVSGNWVTSLSWIS